MQRSQFFGKKRKVWLSSLDKFSTKMESQSSIVSFQSLNFDAAAALTDSNLWQLQNVEKKMSTKPSKLFTELWNGYFVSLLLEKKILPAFPANKKNLFQISHKEIFRFVKNYRGDFQIATSAFQGCQSSFEILYGYLTLINHATKLENIANIQYEKLVLKSLALSVSVALKHPKHSNYRLCKNEIAFLSEEVMKLTEQLAIISKSISNVRNGNTDAPDDVISNINESNSSEILASLYEIFNCYMDVNNSLNSLKCIRLDQGQVEKHIFDIAEDDHFSLSSRIFKHYQSSFAEDSLLKMYEFLLAKKKTCILLSLLEGLPTNGIQLESFVSKLGLELLEGSIPGADLLKRYEVLAKRHHCLNHAWISKTKLKVKETRIENFINKGKWQLAAQFVSFLKYSECTHLSVFLFEALKSRKLYIDADEVYKQFDLSKLVRPVSQIQLDGHRDTKLLKYLQLPMTQDQIHIVHDLASVHLASQALQVQADGTMVLGVDAEWKAVMTSNNQGGKTRGANILQIASSTNGVFIFDLDALYRKNVTTSIALLQTIFSDNRFIKLGWTFSESDIAELLAASNGFFRSAFLKTSGIIPLDKLVKLNKQICRPNALSTGASLSSACKDYLGRELDKSQRLSDWRARPLKIDQLVYAALDAHCLFAICAVVLKEFEALSIQQQQQQGSANTEVLLENFSLIASNADVISELNQLLETYHVFHNKL